MQPSSSLIWVELLSLLAPVVGTVGTLILAVLYWRQYKTSEKQKSLQESMVELQSDQVEAQYRPHLLILKSEMIPNDFFDSCQLKILNEGNGVAHKLRIQTMLVIDESVEHRAEYEIVDENKRLFDNLILTGGLLIQPKPFSDTGSGIQLRSVPVSISARMVEDGELISKVSPDDDPLTYFGEVQLEKELEQDTGVPQKINLPDALQLLQDAGIKEVNIVIMLEYLDLLENHNKLILKQQTLELVSQSLSIPIEQRYDEWRYWDVDLDTEDFDT